jgi:hypothetical protein
MKRDVTLPEAAPEAQPMTRLLPWWGRWRRKHLAQAAARAESQEIVTTLLHQLDPALHAAQDHNVQVELAHLLHLLARMPPRVLVQQRIYFEAAFSLLAAHPPQLELVQSLRADLEAAETQYEGGLAAFILALCGPQPATAILAGLVSIFVLLGLGLGSLVIGRTLLTRLDDQLHHLSPVLHLMRQLPVEPVFTLVCAAFLGSVVSMVLRLRTQPSAADYHPLQLYVSVLFRPLIAVALALFIYAVMRAGLVSFLGVHIDGPQGLATTWVLGFLAGLSERFAHDFIGTTAGKLGGLEGDDQRE